MHPQRIECLNHAQRMRRFGTMLAGALVFGILSGAAQAMEFEVRGLAVLMSGPVSGSELRVLENTLSAHPEITTVVLKNSHGGDARTGYAVGEFIREHRLGTALSGYCVSSCSRMFLGGVRRQFSDEQSLDKTFVAFHGNYANDGSLLTARMGYLKEWVIKYSDGKANPELVEQWVYLPNRRGYAAFYHRDANILPGTQRVLLCQGTEERGKRLEQCAKPELGDALTNGIVTTWDVLRIKPQDAKEPLL